jgi:hypothetical protein
MHGRNLFHAAAKPQVETAYLLGQRHEKESDAWVCQLISNQGLVSFSPANGLKSTRARNGRVLDFGPIPKEIAFTANL